MASNVDPERYRTALIERGRQCAGATDIGPVRRRNEDAYWISEQGTLLVMADGLGGLPGGDVASALAVAAVAEYFAGAPAGHGEALLRDAAEHAQRRVVDAWRRNPALRGMATTLVVVLVGERTASILHVGDSRAALWRAGDFVNVTYDHNDVGDLVRSGEISPEEARFFPGRNQVREVIGLGDGFKPECQSWKLLPGDILLLCTDGVSEAIGDVAMARILAAAPSATAASATLVALAGIEGGQDNATAIVRYVT
ncbi:MAG: PP2C family serine/threonine-protein phosphatase [Candidatus Binatia bacterium]